MFAKMDIKNQETFVTKSIKLLMVRKTVKNSKLTLMFVNSVSILIFLLIISVMIITVWELKLWLTVLPLIHLLIDVRLVLKIIFWVIFKINVSNPMIVRQVQFLVMKELKLLTVPSVRKDSSYWWITLTIIVVKLTPQITAHNTTK